MRDTVRAQCLIVLLLPFALNGCDGELTGVQEDPAEDRVLHGVYHNLADGGRLVARIRADSMYHAEGSQSVLLWGPVMDFSPSYPDRPPNFRGRQLVIHYGDKQLTLLGEAVIEIEARGIRLEGEVLHYSYGGEPSAWAAEKSGDPTSPDTFDPPVP